MGSELISKRQALCIIMLFLFGSTVVVGASPDSEQDSWISLIMAAVSVMPLVLVYARIIHLFPGKDFFEILEALFGKFFGKVIIVLISWYALHLTSLVLRNFTEFIQIVAMPETPQLPLMIAMLLTAAYIAKSGIETLGRWSVVVLPLVVFIILLTTALSFSKMDFSNILPVMEHDFGTLAKGAFGIYTFPFAETVLFLGVASAIKKNDSPYKIYFNASLLAAILLLIVMLRNLEVLGPASVVSSYFPSYVAARIIEVGDFLSRIEIVIAMNFVLTGMVKITVCLMAAAKGTARLFGIADYRRMVMPIGVLVVALCAIVYDSTMDMFSFMPVYQYYALPFQVVIPIIVWIMAEVKTKKQKKQSAPEAVSAS